MATKQGLGATGSVASGLAIIIAGKNTFGKVGDVKNPEFEFETVNEESTGLIKSPNITIEVYDLSPEYLSAMMNGEPFILKGNIRDEGRDKPYIATISAQLHKVGTELKEGDSVKRMLEGRVDVFEEVVDGKQTIKWNRDALVLVLGGDGVNRLADFKNNVM